MSIKSCLILFLLFLIKIGIGQNLVINGDFNSGNTNFSTNYTYCNSNNCLNPLINNGYSIGSNPTFFHFAYVGHDHTTGSGNMMIVNGGVPTYTVWSQSVNVSTNQNYSFSAWACAIYTMNPAQLEFSVNGVVVANITTNNPVNIWNQVSATWNSGASTTAFISIRVTNLAGSNNGVDFGLDDISFTSLNVNPTSQFSASSLTVCVNQPVSFNNSSLNASTYLWNFGDLSTSSQQNPVHTYSIANVYTVSLQASNASNTATSSVNLTVLPNPTISITGNTVICSGNTTSLNASGASNYIWSNGNTSSVISLNPSSTTTYTVVGTTGTCSNSAMITVSVNPSPTITSVNTTSASCGSTDGSATVSASPFSSAYSWSNGQTGNSVGNLSPGNYTLNISTPSCNTQTILSIGASPFPIVSVLGNTLICNGNSAMLNATGANSYLWSNGSTASSISLNISSTTNYTVVGTAGTCTNSAVVTLSVIPYPVISGIDIVDATCGLANGSATITSDPPGNTYVWSQGGIADNVANMLGAGNYSVTAINGACQTSTVIVIKGSLAIAITSSVIVPSGCEGNDGEFIINEVRGGQNPYLINFNNTGYNSESRFTGLKPGNYSVQILDINTCKTNFSILIPDDGDDTLYIPNTFTPNNDGVNDIWYAASTCIRSYRCTIFNRWGSKMIELNTINEGWNGTFKGEIVPDGVYVYIVEVETYNNKNIKKTGHISLFK